ncbi:uncharacterized protein LOC115629923 [Scaptodrosophila lebanonensis]|uniref:Uncharacterized protein LOC115629923 n=1 Tax=Drosophila lebanonensis TaxID=7225 RepID=A0A6J2U4H0_DROLE|nr:uncharacterized protein LOC115629923 [Scaptodrosophila lebanonensis]
MAMLPLVEEDIPEFLLKRNNIAFCNNLRLRGKNKTTLILTRTLKFYEFRKKELLHYIDLSGTCLKSVANELQSYDGPISSFLIPEDLATTSNESICYTMLRDAEGLPLSLGKYVWQGEHVYVLLRCWQILIVLRRPTLHGANFELKAEYNNVQDYRIVRAEIEYQAQVELQFTNGKRKCTNFEDGSNAVTKLDTHVDYSSKTLERLGQRVNEARAEFNLQRANTQQDFQRVRDLETFGAPGLRSPLLEEKQLLSRCGDVWTRVCGDYLVLGTLLANSAGTNRLSIARAVRPLLKLEPTEGRESCQGYNYAYRLYELPPARDGQPPEDYDELAQFWANQQQEQRARRLDWRALTKPQVMPECTAVLLVRLQLQDLLLLERLQLLALYELLNSDGRSSSSRQLFVATIDVCQLLKEHCQHAPSFAPSSMHQDFLAIVMTQTAHCGLNLKFRDPQACKEFEQLLVSSLGFEAFQNKCDNNGVKEDDMATQLFDVTRLDFNHGRDNESSNSSCQNIFYNRQPLSQWCGTLLLHDEAGEEWQIYSRSEAMLCLLLRLLLRDMLQLHCNVTLIRLKNECSTPEATALHFEAALRDELHAWQLSLQETNDTKELISRQTHLLDRQLVTDLIVQEIKSQSPTEA